MTTKDIASSAGKSSEQCKLNGTWLGDDAGRAGHVAEILKALGHPIRIRIVATLCQGEEHVNRLSDRLETKQAIVSQQLRILRMAGLVDVDRRDGRAYYHLAEPRLIELIRCMEGCSI